MIEYVSELNVREYELFLCSHPCGSYRQSRTWAAQNPKWHWQGLIRRNPEGEITGTAAVLLRDVYMLPYQMMYCCRGPVCDPDDTETLKELLHGIASLAEDESVCLIRLDPPVESGNRTMREHFEAYRYKLRDHKHDAPAIPNREWILPLRHKNWMQLQAKFSQEHTQCINMAIRNGINIRHGRRALVPVYADLSAQAALRTETPMFDVDYYTGLIENMNTDIFIAYSDSRPVAGAVMVTYGSELTCVSTLDLSEPSTKAAYLLRAAVLRFAVEHGYYSVVFPGVPEDESSPEYAFENGFGGYPIAYLGEMDRICKPLSGRLSRVFDRINNKLTAKRYFLLER